MSAVEVTQFGWTIAEGATLRLAAARPSVVIRADHETQIWRPELKPEGPAWVADDGPGGARLVLTVQSIGDRELQLEVRLENRGPRPIYVERLTLFESRSIALGTEPSRWRFFRNGYQSWSGTYTLAMHDADRDVWPRFVRASTTDARHAAPSDPGHFRSDTFSALCEPVAGAAFGVGFVTLGDAFGFIELDGGPHPRLTCWADFDGVAIAPGTALPPQAVRIAWASGSPRSGWQVLRRVVAAAGDAMRARRRGDAHPGGWCSWYYYFNRVSERDMVENLDVLAADGRNGEVFGCSYVMIDDGHQAAIGDWLTSDARQFPSGMAALAQRIRSAGLDAGIWWAPFLVAPDSVTARNHPNWLVRDANDRPIVGCVNPLWGLSKPMRVLDTTHPEVLDHLAEVARTIGDDWGYSIQKLDFLYAAALPGRRHDESATRAVSLRRGLEAIRRGAGERSFLLGCGCPLGPAVGIVDAMRIGADVTPYWSNLLSRTVLRDRHGLATKHAVMNTLTRAVLDAEWWLNDPDCLMVRDSETKLSIEEVRLLATVFGITNGMLVLSDRLQRLPPARRELVARARALAGGEIEIADLFERQLPELIVSRRPGRIDVAVLNLTDRMRSKRIELPALGIEISAGEARELWTGARLAVVGGAIELPDLPPHAARVVQMII